MSLIFGLAGLTGCPQADVDQPQQDTLTIAPPDPLKLLVVGDTEIGPRLVRQWKAHQEGELSIENQAKDDWIKAGFPISEGTDLVIYPTLLLGETGGSKEDRKAGVRRLELGRSRQRLLAKPLPPYFDSLR